MRNLKRALSLALASVMLMGMMVVGSSAASFPDVDTDKHNIEAIDVLEKVEVMIGNENGDFEPDKPVTRAEMAVVMAKLLNLDYKYYETTCPFNDVPDWARGWVGACAANGIVSGRGDGVYDPNATVTAVEAASMMMRALGYFQNAGDYEGGFEAATVKQSSRISLFDGIDGNARDPMDRNQVAQLALNTLEARMVDFTGTQGIEIPGVGNVGYESKYEFRTGTENKYRAIAEDGGKDSVGSEGQYYVQLGEQLYSGDLKKAGTSNDFGAPSTRWTYKNNEVGVYANGEDYMFEGEVKSDKMYSTVGRNAAENYTWTVYMDGAKTDKGAALFTGAAVAANENKTLAGTNKGNVTYVYLNDSAKTATACIVNTYAAEIIKAVDGTVTLDDMDKSGLTFDTDTYGVGDVVLYTKSLKGTSTWTVQSILGEAELIEDVADVVRESATLGDRVTIGDKNYSYRFNGTDKIATSSAGETVAFYLDTQENIIKLGEVDESNDFAYVYAVGTGKGMYDNKQSYGATLVLTDGTKMTVDLHKDTTEGRKSLDDVSKKLRFQIVSYSKESNGAYNLEVKTTHVASWKYDGAAGTDVLKEGLTRVQLTSATVKKWDPDTKKFESDATTKTLYLNKNSAVLIHETGESGDDFTAFTGYEAVASVDTDAKNVAGQQNSTIKAYVDGNGVVRAMYMVNAAISGSSDITFVVGQDTNKLYKDKDGNEYHVYDVVRNGEVESIRVKHTENCNSDADKALADLEKDEIAVYSKIKENSSGFVTGVTAMKTSGTGMVANTQSTKSGTYTGVEKVGSEVRFDYNGKGWNVQPGDIKDATVAYYTEDGELVIDGLHTDRNDKVIVVTDDGVVKAVFVKEIAQDAEDVSEELPGTNVTEVNGTLYIASKDGLTTKAIKEAIAAYLSVPVEQVSYNSDAKTATIANGDVYKVETSKVDGESAAAGAGLVAEIMPDIESEPGMLAETTFDGNTVKTDGTGVDGYLTKKEGEVLKVTADLARFLRILHDNKVEEIKYGKGSKSVESYKWDSDGGLGNSNWFVDGERKNDESGKPTNSLVGAISVDIADALKEGEASFTLVADGKTMEFSITATPASTGGSGG